MTRTVAIALVLLSACSNPSTESAQDRSAPGQPANPPSDPASPSVPTPASVSGRLTVTDDEGTHGPFQIGAVNRLTLSGSCASVTPGKHTLRFDVVSPNGTTYCSMPREIVVPDSGSAETTTALPIRGTSVERFMRAGTWNVTLSIDGGEPLASADLDLTR